MSETVPATPSRALSAFFGTLLAFFLIVAILFFLQWGFGGEYVENRQERLDKKAEIAKQQNDLLVKYELVSNPGEIYAKAAEQIATRKPSATTVVVPGTPTAIKAAAAVPPPAAAAPAPAAPAPAPAAPAPHP